MFEMLGLSHAGPMMHSPGPPPPTPSSMAGLEAMHNLSRERELMAFMLANGGRFDPMALAIANSFQVRSIHFSSRIIFMESSRSFVFRLLVTMSSHE
jgi:hypothetical protein